MTYPNEKGRIERQAESVAPLTHLSFEEYLKAYASVEGIRTEWIAGEVRIYPVSNNISHERIFCFLSFLLDRFLNVRSLGEALLDGFPMYLEASNSAREPDLPVVLNEHRDRIAPTRLNGIADVVIEIVSPESDQHDHGAKFVEYEAAGVPEYRLIDPIRSEADFFALGTDKHYHRLARDEKGRLVSGVLPGFALDLALLWRELPPRGTEIVALVQGMAANQ